MQIGFSPPDITQAEIDAVGAVLSKGWITTGKQTKAFERELAAFCAVPQGVAKDSTPNVVALNSCTAALECALRVLGVGLGDEVITTVYTFTASASVIVHVGATPVLVDTAPGSYYPDPATVAAAVTKRTKAIVMVDFAGRTYDYPALEASLCNTAYTPNNDIQAAFDRPAIIADAAHSLGASTSGKPSGALADFTAFSFHAVKNVTTAEGGALAWRETPGLDSVAIYKRLQLLSLHGQSKDAWAKQQAGQWGYDITELGYKYNMTDIAAAIGRVQLERYPQMLNRRKEIWRRYKQELPAEHFELMQHDSKSSTSAYHLCIVDLPSKYQSFRNELIDGLAGKQIASNVHYKPLAMFTAYQALGFSRNDYPNAMHKFQTEISLPLYSAMTDEEFDYIVEGVKTAYAKCV